MDEHVAQLRERISRGDYQVDPLLVADAIIARLHLRALAATRLLQAPDDSESQPDKRPSASVKSAPGSPSTTRPTQVRAAPLAHPALAASIVLRAHGGAHAQSS
jgi:hypothetical protein